MIIIIMAGRFCSTRGSSFSRPIVTRIRIREVACASCVPYSKKCFTRKRGQIGKTENGISKDRVSMARWRARICNFDFIIHARQEELRVSAVVSSGAGSRRDDRPHAADKVRGEP